MRAMAIGLLIGLGTSGLAWAGESEQTLEAQVVGDKKAVEPKAEEAQPGEVAGALAPAATSGGSGSTACTNGKSRRLVEVVGGDAAAKTPCEVHYKKESEQPGHDQVLWSSLNDPQFCQTKAQAFVEKLAGWGWSCNKM